MESILVLVNGFIMMELIHGKDVVYWNINLINKDENIIL